MQKTPGINITPKRGFKNMPESAIKRFFEVNARFYHHGGKIEPQTDSSKDISLNNC